MPRFYNAKTCAVKSLDCVSQTSISRTTLAVEKGPMALRTYRSRRGGRGSKALVRKALLLRSGTYILSYASQTS